mmetsp:Transcript_16909/g.25103  ORF Transcript_16909/g.25103 Transcript_16909/m.25103 type:complete len:368 (+) Transcript_16909:277-1380(+)
MLGGTLSNKLLYILLPRTSQIISCSSVVRDIKTDLLLESINTEPSNRLQDNEEWSHQHSNPTNDEEDSSELTTEKIDIAVQDTSSLRSVCSFNKFRIGENCNSNATPGSVGKVHGDGVNCIINLQRNKSLRGSNVNRTGNQTNTYSSPRLNSRTSSSDSHKSRKCTVHCHGQVVNSLTSSSQGHQVVDYQGTDTTACGSKSGSHGTESGNLRVAIGGNCKSRARVESIPAEPENKCSKHLQCDGMRLKLSGLVERISIGIVEASSTRSKDDRGNKGGSSSSHVNNSTTGKVNHTNTKKRIVCVKSTQESSSIPDCVYNNGVNESSQEKRVANVGSHLTTLSDGSGHNGGSCSGKGELEEPADIVRVM